MQGSGHESDSDFFLEDDEKHMKSCATHILPSLYIHKIDFHKFMLIYVKMAYCIV